MDDDDCYCIRERLCENLCDNSFEFVVEDLSYTNESSCYKAANFGISVYLSKVLSS